MSRRDINYLRDAPRLTPQMVEISNHAKTRWAEMPGVEPEEVRDAIFHPTHAYISRKHASWCFTNGRVSVGVRESADRPGTWVVLTVLWAHDSDWAQDAEVAPPPPGRDLRPRGLR